MNVESLTVALRPRTAWEAVELGSALTRRHAGAIWVPWLWLTVPVFALVNLLAWATGTLWLAPGLMWWLKPVFDRIPLYVLSRAAFGPAPAAAETLRAQWRWGARWMLPYLTWRRLSPVRAVNLPVDLLEGGRGDDARRRRGVITGPAYGVGSLVTLVCVNFEIAMYLGLAALGFLFVPPEALARTAETFWRALVQEPTWIDLLRNALLWTATTVVEPFYVGAGFGLYLNRRTELEGWDIELVFRRLAARLARAASTLLVVALVGFAAWLPARAQDAATPPPPTRVEDTGGAARRVSDKLAPGAARADREPEARPTLPMVFGDAMVDAGALREGAQRAFADPRVSPKRTVGRWKKIGEDDASSRAEPKGLQALIEAIGKAFAFVAEFGLWLLVGLLAVLLLVTAPRWLPRLRGVARRRPREPDPVETVALEEAPPLPDDVPTAARRLWRDGRRREALSLLYRASVEAMAARAGVVLPPGATEAACLRAARRMPGADDREAFAAMVGTWQRAAYAHRWPDDGDFEAQLQRLQDCFGWHRGAPRTGVAA